MSDYTVELLSRKDVLTAYPLVQCAMPEMALKEWKSQARAVIGRSAGILIARSKKRHYICGMLLYRVICDLSAGKTLEASHLVALDILHSRQVTLALLRALAPLARATGCRKVKLVIEDSAPFAGDLPAALLEAEPGSVFEHALNAVFPA